MKLRSLVAVVAATVVGLPVAVAAAPLAVAVAGVSGAPSSPRVAGSVAVGAEQVAALAYGAGFRGWALVEAVAIAGAESTLMADALGDTWPIGGLLCPSHGLWQIRSCPGTPGGLDRGTRAELIDPARNAAAAWRLFRSPRGFRHWSVYVSGAYIAWLPQAIDAAAPWLLQQTTDAAGTEPVLLPGGQP